MPKFKHYTAKLVNRQICAIIKRNPDTINPQSDGRDCLYHQGRGRNIRRCLIGQWGYEQGFRTPKPINGDASEVIDEIWSGQAKFDGDAVDLMVKFQTVADGGSIGSDPVPWRDIVLS